MNIGIDLDNVLADFQTTWLAYHNKRYGTSFKGSDITIYDYAPIMHITSDEVVRRVYEFYESPEFEDIKPETGAVAAISVLSAKNTLFIITSRPDKTIERTRTWVETYFHDSFDEIIHTNQFSMDHDGTVTKAAICLDRTISVMIEDAPNYTKEVAEAGVTVLLLDKAWNRETQESQRIIRVKNWNSIVKKVEKMMDD